MPRICTICSHRDRAQIDAKLVAGLAGAAIARQHGVSDDAVNRHRAHLPAGVAREGNGSELLSQVRGLHSKAVGLLLAAERAGDLRGAMSGIREAARTLELMGKLQGQIGQGDVTVNIVSSPTFILLQATILQALEAFPDARLAVVAALSRTTAIEG